MLRVIDLFVIVSSFWKEGEEESEAYGLDGWDDSNNVYPLMSFP